MQTQNTVRNNIPDYEEIEDFVDKLGRDFIKKNHKSIWYHSFGDLDDIKQVIWTRFLEVKKARELIYTSIKGNKGLLTTIAKRGLIDYVRTQIGRQLEKGKYSKKGTLLNSTYYMDYYESEDGGFFELPVPDKRYSIENIENAVVLNEIRRNYIENKISNDISSWLNKREKRKKYERELTDKEKHVLYLSVEMGMTMKQIGRNLEITESRVSQIYAKSIETLKRKYAD